MAQKHKYSIRDLKKDFPTDAACTEFIFDALHSRKCSCTGTYKLLKNRRQLQCSKCRFQIAPTSGTIFHKSPTPLNLWFHAIFVFSNSKSGISAKQLEREIGVTYKCAWRMLHMIRKALKQSDKPLNGVVETDSGYFGGYKYGGKNNEGTRSMKAKSVVMAAVQRNGELRAQVGTDMSADTLEAFVKKNVKLGSFLMTDSTRSYERLQMNYERHMVHHRKREFVRGAVHVNTIETWFSHIKRSMKGTFKSVSKQHLQSYLDAFVFHYNNRHNDRERFGVLLGALLRA